MQNVKRFTGAAVILLVAIGAWWSVANAQNIRDWWFLRGYTPSQHIAELADAATLSELGRDRFYVGDPALNDKAAFNVNCPFPERTIVLGCYNGRNIYILDVEDPQLEPVEIVTAAHEMLHAAYDRLASDERERVNRLLNEQLTQITDQRILDLIAQYEAQDPDSLDNELHSILGTELASLSPELETYYAQYFADRQQVVQTSDRYEGVFLALEGEIEALDEQIAGLARQIEILEADLEGRNEQLEAKRAELDALQSANQVEAYNALVPVFNQMVRSYNSVLADLRSTVEQHNALVVERNSKAVEQNELVQSIDSNFIEME